ncbi:tRNA glutamyl-Q(34) synthetase GluQRS [Hyphobacterium sp. SN044]|uniref:tRNA glutamyl-Q(34) synthetase GluQRS n=1 Tax=Hyphobacterium sp. SN044 TaxID=2912575 RepID=UPI001F0097AF|nr:tRNA glutamyl-Q(34) synthetase GluQRS [Hyphobacterium sp. SN044]MCF8879765.1 tRNA glutamyl-Q(34) synthetase GluQRS [Hyphobacterium sp. SN044]
MAFVTRFAPSPTGYLHLGHAFSAMTAWRAALEAGGRFLLRIEDIDRTRCKPEFEAAILEDLEWLGITHDGEIRRQSDHFPDYAAALDKLRADGLVYRCFKTRKEIMEEIERAPHHPGEGPEGVIYAGPDEPIDPVEEEGRLAAGDPYAWRLSLGACRERLGADWDGLSFTETGEGPNGETGEIPIRPDLLGDVILARKDVGTSYHMAVVHDDALQGVTHVIRGQDLYHATHLHRLLIHLLGLPVPVWRHHGLMTGPDGKRYAKRDKSATLKSMRERGMTRKDVLTQLGFRD